MECGYGNGNGEILADLIIYNRGMEKELGRMKETEKTQAMFQIPFHLN